MKGFDFEEERIKREIARLGSKRVLLQLPEGLKTQGPQLAEIIEKVGAVPVISADPCYGACDLAIDEAQSLGVDLVIHFGHSRIAKHEAIPTIYIEARATIAVGEALEKSISLLKDYARIGLATTIQHVQNLGQARELLVKAGKTVVIGDSGILPYKGQVTGCDYSNAKSILDDVDAFLFIGGGRFHALGIALSTSKPTFIANPYENTVCFINEEASKLLKKRWKCIDDAKSAKRLGILVGLKSGQKHIETALKIKKMVKKIARKPFVLAAREILPTILLQFPTIDAYVNTACPRISLDFPAEFSKPVLTLNEFRVVSGEYTWETLLKKGFFENEI